MSSRLLLRATATAADRRSDMTKLLAVFAIAIALLAGAAVVVAVHGSPAAAACQGSGC
jgi:hypothetical protein